MSSNGQGRPDNSWRIWLNEEPIVGSYVRYGNTYLLVVENIWWRRSDTGTPTTITIWKHPADGRIGTSGRRAHSVNWSWAKRFPDLSEAELIAAIRDKFDTLAQIREDDW